MEAIIISLIMSVITLKRGHWGTLGIFLILLFLSAIRWVLQIF